MALALLAFACSVTIVVGLYWLAVLRPEQAKESEMKRRLVAAPAPKTRRAGLIKEAKRLSALPALDRLLVRSRTLFGFGPLERLLEQSAVKASLGVIVLTSCLLALVGFALGQRMFYHAWAGVLLACALCPAPVLYLTVKRQRRVRRFEELFPEAMDLLARAMRAGHTFPTGLGMVADEMPQPVSGEFRLLFDRQNFGAPLADVLREFARRVPLLDARIFATAILTQREAGGNLAEVLDNMASVVRRRFIVKRQVQAKSAHGRMTGWVLIAMPPAMALIITMLSPSYMRPLVDDPVGVRLMIAGLVLQVVGTLVIRRLVRIDY